MTSVGVDPPFVLASPALTDTSGSMIVQKLREILPNPVAGLACLIKPAKRFPEEAGGGQSLFPGPVLLQRRKSLAPDPGHHGTAGFL